MENEEIKVEEKQPEQVETSVEEKKVEAPVEEPKVEEKPAEKKVPHGEIIEIEKLDGDARPLQEEIEEKRVALVADYKKSRKMSNISMAVVVVAVIGAMVLLLVNATWSKITGYSLGGAALVGLIVFSMLTKNKFPSKSREYIRFVTTKIDQHIYNNTEFQDVKVNLGDKYTTTELGLDRIYNNLVDIGSRNIVKGRYLGDGFSCGELALYTTKSEGKKTMKAVAFIGKHLELQNTLHFEGRYILVFKGEKPTDLPTDIEDLVELHNDENFVVYGTEGSDYSKDIPAKYISALKKIKVAGNLLNLNVVLWAGHTGVYLSYDDPVVSLPFDKPFEAEAQYAFKDHLLAVLDAERLINK